MSEEKNKSDLAALSEHDWDVAIEEWDAGLDLPVTHDTPISTDAVKSDAPVPADTVKKDEPVPASTVKIEKEEDFVVDWQEPETSNSPPDVLSFAVDLASALGTFKPIPATTPTSPPSTLPKSGRLVDEPSPLAKLPAEFTLPELSLPDRFKVQALGREWAEEELELLEGERQLARDTAQQLPINLAAGRAAWRAGRHDDARRCFANALAIDARNLPALRAARRLAIVQNDGARAAALLARERELIPVAERANLEVLRAELLLAAGDLQAARQSYDRVFTDDSSNIWAATGRLDALAAARVTLEEMGESTNHPVADKMWEAARACERGRSEELAGNDQRAAAFYQAALTRDPSLLAANLGLWRTLLRLGDADTLILGQQSLEKQLPASFANAMRRRTALLKISMGHFDEAADYLARADDTAGLQTRALAEESAGRSAALLTTLNEQAQSESGTRRQAAWLRKGALEERAGLLSEARLSYRKSVEANPDDLAAQLAEARIARVQGDMDRVHELLPGLSDSGDLAATMRGESVADRAGDSATRSATIVQQITAAGAGDWRKVADLAASPSAFGDRPQAPWQNLWTARLEERAQNPRGAAEKYGSLLEDPFWGTTAAWLLLPVAWQAGESKLLVAGLARLLAANPPVLWRAALTLRHEEAIAPAESVRGMVACPQELDDVTMPSYWPFWQTTSTTDPTLHARERLAVKNSDWDALLAILGQIDANVLEPSLAFALTLDRLRLGEVLERDDAASVASNLELAHKLRPSADWVAARLFAVQHELANEPRVAELAREFADFAPHGPTALLFALEETAILLRTGHKAEAVERIRWALEHTPNWVAARRLARLALSEQSWKECLDAALKAAAGHHLLARRVNNFLLAAWIAENKLANSTLATQAFQEILVEDEGNRPAFEGLCALLEKQEEWKQLADAIAGRTAVETAPEQLLALHLKLAELCRDRLQDREAAKRHLRQVLLGAPTHTPAIHALAQLHLDDGEWSEAADALVRCAQIEHENSVLHDLFITLGRIYTEHLPDLKRALVSFTRALQCQSDDRYALTQLSDLYSKTGEWTSALATTQRLLELTTSTDDKVAGLLRLAHVYEDGFRDTRAAKEVLQSALNEDPMNLAAIERLARFYQRQGDLPSARAHLDQATARARAEVLRAPHEPVAYHILYRILVWLRAHDQACTVVSLLEAKGEATREELDLLVRFSGSRRYPGPSLAMPVVDEILCEGLLPAGLRHLFQLIDDPLRRFLRSQEKRDDTLEKASRQSSQVLDLAKQIGEDLGLTGVDVFFTPAPRTLRLLPSDTPALIISRDLADAPVDELRFFLGRSLKMIQCGMLSALYLPSEQLALLMGGIVRHFAPNFVPNGLAEADVTREASRLSRIIAKKLHQEILPLALECADPKFDLRSLSAAALGVANRAGLIAAGSAPAALAALRRLGEEKQAAELLSFVISNKFSMLRRLTGTAVG